MTCERVNDIRIYIFTITGAYPPGVTFTTHNNIHKTQTAQMVSDVFADFCALSPGHLEQKVLFKVERTEGGQNG